MNDTQNKVLADSARLRLPSIRVTQWVKVALTHGLHLRVCSAISNAVGRHRANVSVWKGRQCADAGSVLELLLLDVPRDTELMLEARGKDAPEALQAVAELLVEEFLDRC